MTVKVVTFIFENWILFSFIFSIVAYALYKVYLDIKPGRNDKYNLMEWGGALLMSVSSYSFSIVAVLLTLIGAGTLL